MDHVAMGGISFSRFHATAMCSPTRRQRRAPAPGSGSGKNGELLLRDKVESTTDPDARIYGPCVDGERSATELSTWLHSLLKNSPY